MAGSASARLALESDAPQTNRALQHLVMAMADVVSSSGKRTLFGRDKGPAAVEKFNGAMLQTIRAMQDDGLIDTFETSESVRATLMSLIELFAAGYPNWKDAFGFAVFIFVHRHEEAVANIDSIRQGIAAADYAFDNPSPSRGRPG